MFYITLSTSLARPHFFTQCSKTLCSLNIQENLRDVFTQHHAQIHSYVSSTQKQRNKTSITKNNGVNGVMNNTADYSHFFPMFWNNDTGL